MKHQQLLLKLNVDDDKLRGLCASLPLKKQDQRIAYALAVLCSRVGAYAPEHGKGQAEIAQLAGVGVRTVQRRIKYLVRYGILNIERENGRANVYQFDNVMLFDCPRPTFDIYRTIKPATPAPSPTAAPLEDAEALPLFDQEETTPAPAAIEAPSILERITRVAGCLFSMLTQKGLETTASLPETTASLPETAATPAETPASLDPASLEPPPVLNQQTENPRQSVGERNKTAATLPGSYPKPPPTAANSALHIHSTLHKKEHLKTSIIHNHGGGDGNLNSDSEEDQVGTGEPGTPPPSGVRKVSWGREVRERDLANPVALQELYLVAVDQGFFLEIDTARINFFALAHYCWRAKKVANKIGLFSANVDRTVKDKFNQPFEKKLSQADEEWARKAIKQIDFPPLATRAERMQQA